MSSDERILVVVRHAKSDWHAGEPDIRRPLNARGLRDAAAVGRWLAAQGMQIDAAVVSPSARTQATWSGLAEAARLEASPAVSNDIYLGGMDDLAQAVRELPEGARCAALVGHSPGCFEFVEWITDGQGDADALERMRVKFPTAAVAVVRVRVAWAEIGIGSGRLEQFAVCRG